MADEKYRTQLTGAQVDDALQQLNQRVAEGWAVGTRDGSPVGSGSEYYHNNAKYWAEQSHSSVDAAEAAAERAESAVPAGTAGAVFFDREQSLTDTQKEQARKNIAAGNTNPNLIPNWYFVGGGSQLGAGKFPINQRGKTTYTGNEKMIDLWGGANSVGTMNVLPEGIMFTNSGSGYAYPRILLDRNIGASEHTLSVIADGVLYTAQGTNSIDLPSGLLIYWANPHQLAVRVPANLSSSEVISAIKYEKGTVSTLLQDGPPNFGEELTKCVYYAGDPADTCANNGFGRSNRNLLDNWYLAGGGTGENFPINQRSMVGSSISTSGYFIDRWKSNNANNVGIFSGYVRILAGGGMRQYLPLSAIKKGVYTVSAMLEGGQVYSVTGILDPAGTSGTWQLSKHLLQNVLWCGVRVDNGKWDFDFTSTNSANIVAVKLEAGAISTLANDTPPNYAEELAKCQYYFERKKIFGNYGSFGTGIAVSTTNAEILIPMRTKRNTSYTIATSGSFAMLNGAAITSIVKDSGSTDMLALYITTTGLTAGQACLMRASTDPNAYIDIINDL